MKLIGLTFNKMAVERLSDSLVNLKIKINMDIADIKNPKNKVLKGKEELLEVNFNYIVDYSPKIAKLDLSGKVLVTTESKEAKKIIKDWESKKLSEGFKTNIFNIILRKSNIKALQLEEEVNLPLHIPFPSIKQEGK